MVLAKTESEKPNSRLAVLIDADNAQASVIEAILAEVARFGEATVKRIYGDFTTSNSSSWKAVLQQFAIKPVQQFAYTTGKNATDSALIIDAMDLLYSRKFDGFCLVTSDSDFTGLAIRIREEGLMVVGFGLQKTPDAFRRACNKFILTEVLRPSVAETKTVTPNTKADAKPAPAKAAPSAAPTPIPKFPKDFVLDALGKSSDENGWAYLATFGIHLNKLQPGFARVYGHKNLTELVKAKTDLFVTEERTVPGQSKNNLYLKAK